MDNWQSASLEGMGEKVEDQSSSSEEFEYKYHPCLYRHNKNSDMTCLSNNAYGSPYCYLHMKKYKRKLARLKLFEDTMQEAEEIIKSDIYKYDFDTMMEQLGKCKTSDEIIRYMHWQ